MKLIDPNTGRTIRPHMHPTIAYRQRGAVRLCWVVLVVMTLLALKALI